MEETLKQDSRFTMYHPSEVELSRTTKQVLEEADRIRPKRVVLDSLSEVRLMAEHPLRYRRQILALKQAFSKMQSTVLLVHDRMDASRDTHLYLRARHGTARRAGAGGLLRHRARLGSWRRHGARRR